MADQRTIREIRFVNLKRFTDENDKEWYDAQKRDKRVSLLITRSSVRLLEHGRPANRRSEKQPDPLKSEWKDFVINEIIGERQNSALFKKQEAWEYSFDKSDIAPIRLRRTPKVIY